MKPNERKRGTAITRAYYNKFAWRDFPEGYWNITTNKRYETLKGYMRSLKKLSDRDFNKEFVNNTLYNIREYRKELRQDLKEYYKMGRDNAYKNF